MRIDGHDILAVFNQIQVRGSGTFEHEFWVDGLPVGRWGCRILFFRGHAAALVTFVSLPARGPGHRQGILQSVLSGSLRWEWGKTYVAVFTRLSEMCGSRLVIALI